MHKCEAGYLYAVNTKEEHVLPQQPLIQIRDLSKIYSTPEGEVVALDHVDLNVHKGEIYGVIGMSGAGKSTLIRCINRLDTPNSGSILYHGQDILTMSKADLLQLRRKVSMIFQQFNLLMQRTVGENVRYPLEIAGVARLAASFGEKYRAVKKNAEMLSHRRTGKHSGFAGNKMAVFFI